MQNDLGSMQKRKTKHKWQDYVCCSAAIWARHETMPNIQLGRCTKDLIGWTMRVEWFLQFLNDRAADKWNGEVNRIFFADETSSLIEFRRYSTANRNTIFRTQSFSLTFVWALHQWKPFPFGPSGKDKRKGSWKSSIENLVSENAHGLETRNGIINNTCN